MNTFNCSEELTALKKELVIALHYKTGMDRGRLIKANNILAHLMIRKTSINKLQSLPVLWVRRVLNEGP